MRSTVAQQVGAPVERRGSGAGAVVYGYWSGLETNGYEWIFRPGACAGVIPTNDGLACVFAGSTRSGRPGRAGRAEAVVRRGSPSSPPGSPPGPHGHGVRSFAGHPGYLRRAWGPGWALVGDAGYWKDPISAHGLTDAFRDAELLARAVVSTASGDVPRRRPWPIPGHP